MDANEHSTCQIKCVDTGETREVRQLKRGGAAMPRGWKRLGEQIYSPQAWRNRYVLRAICVPVAGVLNDDQSPEANRAAWSELRTALQTSWRQATQVSNWIMVELAKYDSQPLVDSDAGPRLPTATQLIPSTTLW